MANMYIKSTVYKHHIIELKLIKKTTKHFPTESVDTSFEGVES